jgi:hypothetical protein
MALTPQVRATQMRALVVGDATPAVQVTQMRGLATINFPTQEVQVTNLLVNSVVAGPARSLRVSQMRAIVVARGRNETPKARDWTYTLDAHDFYILQTRFDTIVFDLSTGASFIWGTEDSTLWRAHTGVVWQRPLLDAINYSNIMAGDDTLGTLYLLNPNDVQDDSPDPDRPTRLPFQRVIYGQIAVRGRDSVPCNGVEVYGSIGAPDSEATLTAVTLSTSDDRGNTFTDHGTLTVTPEVYDTRLDWLSLGSMTAPGRLFKLVDYGALVRVDDFEMPDTEE